MGSLLFGNLFPCQICGFQDQRAHSGRWEAECGFDGFPLRFEVPERSPVQRQMARSPETVLWQKILKWCRGSEFLLPCRALQCIAILQVQLPSHV